MTQPKPPREIDPATTFPAIPDASPSQLTETQRLIASLIARGLCKKEIAKAMHLSLKTVENHVCRAFERLGIHDKVMLTRWAIRAGLVDA